MDKNKIAGFLKKIGLYKSTRWIYNKILRYNKFTETNIAGNTLKFWTPTFYLDEYVSNFSEKIVIDKFGEILPKADIFWDIGANIGIYSIFAAHIMDDKSIVYAFEPEKKSYILLNKNIQLNNLTNIVTLPVALADQNREGIIYASDTPNFGAHSLMQRTDFKVKSKGDKVRINTADTLVEDGILKVPDVIKIDVEGSENMVIEGLKKTLENPKVKTVLCEVHLNLLEALDDSGDFIVNTLSNLGFNYDVLEQRGNQSLILFSRNSQI